jgi:branched-chain amino acid transport system substrate-binding protein
VARNVVQEQFTKAGAGDRIDPLSQPTRLRTLPQRASDAKPDAIFVFSGQGATFVKQFIERGLDKAGIKISARAM